MDRSQKLRKIRREAITAREALVADVRAHFLHVIVSADRYLHEIEQNPNLTRPLAPELDPESWTLLRMYAQKGFAALREGRNVDTWIDAIREEARISRGANQDDKT